MLRVENLNAFYGPVQILHNIDIAVEALRESLKEISYVPSKIYDFANKALKLQYYLPPTLLRLSAHLLTHPPNLMWRR